MTHRLALGITVGASNSVAVATMGDDHGDNTGPVAGGIVAAQPTVLRFGADALPTFGIDAHAAGRHSDDVLLDGFLARVGDPVDIRAEDGSIHRAADLVATAASCLIDEIDTRTTQSDPTGIAVLGHPAHWTPHTVAVQRNALDRAGLREVALVPEPMAALRWLELAHGRCDDGALVVFDLGAGGLTVSVLRTGAQSEVLGTPLHSTEVACAEFDLLLMRYVLANALGDNDFDPFDPMVERELSALRERCRNAKEALSINTATVVPVRLLPAAGHPINIRLVRSELEELLRGPLLTATALLRDAVHRAGLEIGDINRVLLTGGGSAIPLAAELISAEFGLPVVAAADPGQTSARGAAALAADLLAADTATADPATELIAATSKTTAPPAVSAPPPALPEPSERGRLRWQRLAVVAGAAVAIGLLATGTVAVGTRPSSNSPAPMPNSTTAHDAAGETRAPAAPVIAPIAQTDSTGQPRTEGGQPASGVPAGQNGTTIIVAANQPPASGAPAPTDPAAPQQPAPPPPGGAPPPAQPTVVPLPTNMLGDTVDSVGDVVGTVLRAPGEIVGGFGG